MVVEEGLPVAQSRAALHCPEQQAASDIADEAQQCHITSFDAEFGELGWLCREHVAQAMEPLQQQRFGLATSRVGQKPDQQVMIGGAAVAWITEIYLALSLL